MARGDEFKGMGASAKEAIGGNESFRSSGRRMGRNSGDWEGGWRAWKRRGWPYIGAASQGSDAAMAMRPPELRELSKKGGEASRGEEKDLRRLHHAQESSSELGKDREGSRRQDGAEQNRPCHGHGHYTPSEGT